MTMPIPTGSARCQGRGPEPGGLGTGSLVLPADRIPGRCDGRNAGGHPVIFGLPPLSAGEMLPLPDTVAQTVGLA